MEKVPIKKLNLFGKEILSFRLNTLFYSYLSLLIPAIGLISTWHFWNGQSLFTWHFPIFWSFCSYLMCGDRAFYYCNAISFVFLSSILCPAVFCWHVFLLLFEYTGENASESCELKQLDYTPLYLLCIWPSGLIWLDILRDGFHLIIIACFLLYLYIFHRDEEDTRPIISMPLDGRLLNPPSISNRRRQRKRRQRRSTIVFRYVLRRTGRISCRRHRR